MKHSAIKENHLYNKVFRRGDRFIGKLVTVHILTDYAAKKRMLAHPLKLWTNRVGLSVSKKLGGAVERNRAKRVIRAAYDSVKSELKTGNLIVISPRSAIASAKSTDVTRELRNAFGELGLLLTPKTQDKTQ